MLFIKEKKKRQMIRNINSLLPPFLTQEVKNLTIWMPFFRWNFYVMKIAMRNKTRKMGIINFSNTNTLHSTFNFTIY